MVGSPAQVQSAEDLAATDHWDRQGRYYTTSWTWRNAGHGMSATLAARTTSRVSMAPRHGPSCPDSCRRSRPVSGGSLARKNTVELSAPIFMTRPRGPATPRRRPRTVVATAGPPRRHRSPGPPTSQVRSSTATSRSLQYRQTGHGIGGPHSPSSGICPHHYVREPAPVPHRVGRSRSERSNWHHELAETCRPRSEWITSGDRPPPLVPSVACRK